VESVIAAVSGVPAIVLQYQVGLENSPWSQMAQARRMAYDDTIVPTWRKYERVLTRQLLRPIDVDATHFIRFDKSDIDSLRRDQLESAQIANAMGKQASLNERRTIMGLEPATAKQDPNKKADDIPELVQPSMAQILAAQTANANNASAPANTPAGTPAAGDTTPADATPPPKKSNDKLLMILQRKAKVASLAEMLREEAFHTWGNSFHQQLQKDREAIKDIVSTFLTDATHKSIESKARGKDRAMNAVNEYLRTEGKRGWTRTAQPLMVQGAERSIAVASSDLVSVSYQVLHPAAIAFAQRNAAKMVTEVSRTTKQLINDIVTAGLQENQSTNDIANLIRDATGFSKARSALIARTETTSIYSGAPVESLMAFSKATGRLFLKTWFGVMDDKERDEHVAMEGETVGIDENFSNGLPYPSEPNCRCHVLTYEQEE
jgi:SPP1 gp7 family putative phage head morphogenesis protein